MKSQARLRLRTPIHPIYTPSGTPVVCSCGGLILSRFILPISFTQRSQADIFYQCIHCDRTYVRA